MSVNVPFFDVCNSLANERYIDASFFEDQYDGWFCRFSFSDARGPYSAVVGLQEKINTAKHPAEDYEKRVRKICDTAIAKAHASRAKKMAA